MKNPARIFIIILFLLLIGLYFILKSPIKKDLDEIQNYQRVNISYLKGIWPAPGTEDIVLEKESNKLKNMGVNVFPISVLFNIYQDGSIKLLNTKEWEGKGKIEYTERIRKAHEKGFAVFLELDPVYVGKNDYKGGIQSTKIPEKIKQKFIENFEGIVLEWGEIAEKEKVEFFSPINEPNSEISLGNELSIKFIEKILPLIKEKFKGEIVIKFAEAGPKNISKYGTIKGYDYLAIDVYAMGVSEKEFEEYLNQIIKESLEKVEKYNLKGFIFGELGVEPKDESFQASVFQRIFEKTWNKTKGYLISGWGENIDPSDDFNVVFTNKPAEKVIKNWYKREIS